MLGPTFVVLQHQGAIPWELVLHASVYEALPDTFHRWLGACFTEGVTDGPKEEARRAAIVEMLGDLWLPDLDTAAVVLGYNDPIFGERWQSYRVDAAGVVLWPPPPSDVPAPLRSLRPGRNDPPTPSHPFPYLRLNGTTDHDSGEAVEHTLLVRLYRRVVRHADSPLTALGEWGADEREHISYHGVDALPPSRREAELRRMTAALRFFQVAMARGGRPRGTGTFRDRDEFLTAVRAAVVGLGKQGRRPTEENVAAFFGNHDRFPKCSDVRQLRRWCRDFKFATWDEVLAALRSR